MRASTAFFAGAGTVIVAIAAGLGGGLVMGNIMSPQQGHHAFSRFERRAAPSQSPQPWPITTAKTAGPPVPYLAATEKAIAKPMVVPPSQDAAQKTARAASRPNTIARSVSGTKQSTQPQPSPIQQASRDQASDPDNANAQARDADLKRLDEKKNRSDRRRQWAARRAQQQQLQDQREADDQAWNNSRDGNNGWEARRRSGDNGGWRDARDGSREMIVRRQDPDESDRPLFGRPRFDFPHFDLFGRD